MSLQPPGQMSDSPVSHVVQDVALRPLVPAEVLVDLVAQQVPLQLAPAKPGSNSVSPTLRSRMGSAVANRGSAEQGHPLAFHSPRR